MFKLVTSNKEIIKAAYKLPVVKHLFVYDYSKLNDIKDEKFYNLVYSHIVVSNGLTKTTRSNRFDDLDEITISILKGEATNSFHDIGVSNGITSLELYNKLTNNKVNINFYISDKYVRLFYKGKLIRRFFDSEGNLVSVNFLSIHISPNIGKLFFLSRGLFKLFKRKADLNTNEFQEILLLAPAVYEKLDKGIQLMDFDLFASNYTKQFDFLRCMNVLMPVYFTHQTILNGVINLKNGLNENGYLLLGRTDSNNVNHATFYQKSGNQLVAIKVVNNGFDYNNPQ